MYNCKVSLETAPRSRIYQMSFSSDALCTILQISWTAISSISSWATFVTTILSSYTLDRHPNLICHEESSSQDPVWRGFLTSRRPSASSAMSLFPFLTSQEVHQSPSQSHRSSLWCFSVDECRGGLSIIMHEIRLNLQRCKKNIVTCTTLIGQTTSRADATGRRVTVTARRTHDQWERKSTIYCFQSVKQLSPYWRSWRYPMFQRNPYQGPYVFDVLLFVKKWRLTYSILHVSGWISRLIIRHWSFAFVRSLLNTSTLLRDSTPKPQMSCLYSVCTSTDTRERFTMYPA